MRGDKLAPCLCMCYELSDPQSVLASLGHHARAQRVATLETFHHTRICYAYFLHAYIYEIQVSYISYIYTFSSYFFRGIVQLALINQLI